MESLRKYRLKVFISSAMGAETGTDWRPIRASIQKKLLECEYLDPFIIEDHANVMSSTQLFTFEVKSSDIIVILVKGEIRPGTNQEIETALGNRKPILVYFNNSSEISESVEEFKSFLIKKDITTFKIVENFNDIDQVVYNDVINNLISYYRFEHDVADHSIQENFVSSEGLFDNTIFDKKFLEHFGNNQDTFINFLSLSNFSTNNDADDNNIFGIKLLSWLCNGIEFYEEADIDTIFKRLLLPENIVKILRLRHKSIQRYFDHDFKGALNYSDEAYELAKDSNAPDWLIGDILIDSRNINSQLELFDPMYQKKINELENFIYFPVGDRFLKESFETLEKERLAVRTTPVSSIRFGNTLLSSLQSIENYLYTSFVTGSSTHLLYTRKRLIEILIEYGEIYEDENLIYQSLRLMILSGDEKMFSKVLETYWDKTSNALAVNVEHLWDLTEGKYCINDEIMKCLIIKSLGQYMNNSLFIKSTIFLVKYSEQIDVHEKAMYILNSIKNNFKRFDRIFILEILLNILKSGKLILYGEMTIVLSNIDLSNSEYSDIEELNSLIKKNIDMILQNNGSPFFIVNLLKQHAIFKDLYELIKKNEILTDEQIHLIDLELGNSNNALKILTESITTLESRFNDSQSVRIAYIDNPLAIVIEMIKKFENLELIDLINKRLIPLSIKTLSSKTSIEIKQSYLKMLISVLVEYKKNKNILPIELIDFFSLNKIELEDDLAYAKASAISSNYYLNTIKALLNLDIGDNIIFTYVDYKNKSKNDRDSFSYSIQKYIEYNLVCKKDIPIFITMIVLELLRDEYFVVRKKAIKCLVLLYKYSSSEHLREELIRMTLDISPNVKSHYLFLIEKELINQPEAKELLTLFSRDASFNIRETSKKLLSDSR